MVKEGKGFEWWKEEETRKISRQPPCVDRSIRGRRLVDPERVTKGIKGLGEEEGRELSDFQMEATMKR